MQLGVKVNKKHIHVDHSFLKCSHVWKVIYAIMLSETY